MWQDDTKNRWSGYGGGLAFDRELDAYATTLLNARIRIIF
jgi:hypothetical protein